MKGKATASLALASSHDSSASSLEGATDARCETSSKTDAIGQKHSALMRFERVQLCIDSDNTFVSFDGSHGDTNEFEKNTFTAVGRHGGGSAAIAASAIVEPGTRSSTFPEPQLPEENLSDLEGFRTILENTGDTSTTGGASSADQVEAGVPTISDTCERLEELLDFLEFDVTVEQLNG
ncbi:unnamed protein product, partial [Amoebophrya sp. A25]|eukprot:GSA25T00015635001.1